MSSPIWIRAFGERERLSGLPLVHHVYFIMYAGESHAKPLMFSKTLSMMDDGRKNRGWVERVKVRERKNERKRRRYRNECCEGTPYLLTSLFFLSLRTGGKFSSSLSWPGARMLLFSLSSFRFSFRLEHRRTLLPLICLIHEIVILSRTSF